MRRPAEIAKAIITASLLYITALRFLAVPECCIRVHSRSEMHQSVAVGVVRRPYSQSAMIS